MAPTDPAATLAELRRNIDRIDAAMHGLLMERGEIIDRLIASKGTGRSGSAFRPEREASMMRELAARHRGLLPLDTAEGIWRVIIATFTYVQAPFSVHCDVSGGDAPMRDSARFHFGFTVPYLPREDGHAVIDAVVRSRGDLGLLRIDQGASAGAWWERLESADAPKVIARLPFIERPDHPAGTPVFAISKPVEGAGARDVLLLSVRLDRWSDAAAALLAETGGEIVASAGDAQGLSLLVAVPGDGAPATLATALAARGARPSRVVEVGSHAERFSAPPT